ncbi:hypothetical protein [Flavobacterium piscis]|uniref:Recombinase domain-containing protein n=1 Tax=Flavobacterium piscis TaxID=1114874 RepID=A0ABU1Y3C1_9FLAO|nr:hypothetical protein [Flavobacterium piscis]MDR7208563.1 hypothetical protein [Flavobacterium piscis]
MKKVFKTGYSKEVQQLLEEKGIWNKKGLPFSKSYITHVFNGRNCNNDIEETIIELYQKRLHELTKITLRRKVIFSEKNMEEELRTGSEYFN